MESVVILNTALFVEAIKESFKEKDIYVAVPAVLAGLVSAPTKEGIAFMAKQLHYKEFIRLGSYSDRCKRTEFSLTHQGRISPEIGERFARAVYTCIKEGHRDPDKINKEFFDTVYYPRTLH